MQALGSPGQYIGNIKGGGRKVVTTAGTRVQLTATSTPCEGVILEALEANTGHIVVGGADVVASAATRVGFRLPSGENPMPVLLPVKDLSLIWLDSTVNGEGISYMPLS